MSRARSKDPVAIAKDEEPCCAPLSYAAAKGGCVYFLRCNSEDYYQRPIKIGHTTNLAIRISNIQIASPFHICLAAFLVTPDYRELEAMLHARFAAQRIRGEWFDTSPTLESAIDAIRGLQRQSLNVTLDWLRAQGTA